ncbi:peptidoglycan editing factor PgeF [Parashewanella curva]|uniref:Purine nucleoside phosphorylase n=1 Tax=Parashewanella curva TaxID=2338552 RepID=A0A3L8Q1W4_9GAMM|nr:peptidoglycan editing factor PgeF [Parashewanella curva]RLV61677.1 peptidoglycan editing factor PgeF [Parashewanella curva]
MFYKHRWPVPENVGIAMTTRYGGVSMPPFDSLNLALHVEDDKAHVQANRERLKTKLGLNVDPTWLEQVHGTEVVSLPQKGVPVADGSHSNQVGQVCVVMTADCLPVLLCNDEGTEVSALHAGWRGLCDGVIESGVAKFQSQPQSIRAYLGSAISAQAFEVGAEVKQAFVNRDDMAEECFKPFGHKFLADLQGLAVQRLHSLGIKQIYLSNQCTFSSSDYFSYRRDGLTGRQASLIWIK